MVKSCNEIGDDTFPNEFGNAKQLSYTLLPTEVTSCMREPLAFLSWRRLFFLDRDRWICVWRLPSASSRAGKAPMRTGGGFRNTDGDTASSSKDRVNSIETHYFLPGDRVTADEAHFCAVMADGTLLCPRNGDIATVQCAKLRR